MIKNNFDVGAKIIKTNESLEFKNCKHLFMNEDVALKPYNLTQFEERKILEEIKKKGGNQYIVNYIGIFKKEKRYQEQEEKRLCENDDEFYLGMERGFASLNKVTDSDLKIISIENLLIIFLHVVKGLSYLKSLRIAHLDIKPSNIMIDKERKRAKLIDFGISQTELTFRKDFSSGTKGFFAPEIESNSKYKFEEFEEMFASDIYSLGKTFEIMITSAFPENHSILKELSDYITDSMIKNDPKKRKKIEEVENFLKEIMRKHGIVDDLDELILVNMPTINPKPKNKSGKYNQTENTFVECAEKEITEWDDFMNQLRKIERPTKAYANYREILVYNNQRKMVLVKRVYKGKEQFLNETLAYYKFNELREENPFILKNYPGLLFESFDSGMNSTDLNNTNFFEYPFCTLDDLVAAKKEFKFEDMDIILSSLSNLLLFLYFEAGIHHGNLKSSESVWLCRTECRNFFSIKVGNFSQACSIEGNEFEKKNKNKEQEGEGEQEQEDKTAVGKKSKHSTRTMKLKSIDSNDAKAIDIFDMGKLFYEISRNVCNLTIEENKIKMDQWKNIISLMTHENPQERLSALYNLEKLCIKKSLYFELDNSTKQAIIRRVVKQEEENSIGPLSNTHNSQSEESSTLRFKNGLTLSKILAYQDIQLASDYQIMEENLNADNAERYPRKKEENTEHFFNRLLEKTEKPNNMENFFQQNKILTFIKKNCPDTLIDVRHSALSRLLRNYTLQSYIEHADNLAKELEEIYEGEGAVISESSKLEIVRGLAVYSHRRNNNEKKIKYRDRFETLALNVKDSEKINAWRGGILFYCFESRLIEKKEGLDEMFQKYFNDLAGNLIKIISDKIKGMLIGDKNRASLEYKLGNIYEDQIWILGRYCHEKKKQNDDKYKINRELIDEGYKVIQKMREYYSLHDDINYLEEKKFHSQWNKEGIFYNNVENEDSLKINIKLYPKIINAARLMQGGARVGYAHRNYADTLISLFYVEGKKNITHLEKAKASLEEEEMIGRNIINASTNPKAYLLDGTLERIRRINLEIELEKSDPEKASKTRAQFWARKL